jgi:hypothetical protein
MPVGLNGCNYNMALCWQDAAGLEGSGRAGGRTAAQRARVPISSLLCKAASRQRAWPCGYRGSALSLVKQRSLGTRAGSLGTKQRGQAIPSFKTPLIVPGLIRVSSWG